MVAVLMPTTPIHAATAWVVMLVLFAMASAGLMFSDLRRLS